MPATPDRSLRVATRGSRLALAQSGDAAHALMARGAPEIDLFRVRTEGDVNLRPLTQIGGTGVFVAAVREAVLAGAAELAIHSLKDLPTSYAAGLAIGAVPPRADPRDVICARDSLTLSTLPERSRVGTGSPRRAAQLRQHRPDLDVIAIRGNVDTRLGKVTSGELDAVVLAHSGLARLGRLEHVTEEIDPLIMIPAPGQGALAVEVASMSVDPSDPHRLREALARLDDPATRICVTAERALLAALEAGCTAPVGAFAEVRTSTGTPVLALDAITIAPDGTRAVRRSGTVALPEPDGWDDGPVEPELTVAGLGLTHESVHRSGSGAADASLAAAIGLGVRLATEMLGEGAAELLLEDRG